MQMKSLKSVAGEAGPWLALAFGGYVLWSFRGVFSSAGGAAGAAVEGLLQSSKDKLEKKVDKGKVQATAGAKRPVTDAEVAKFKQDAASLAAMFGYDTFGLKTIFKDTDAAFTLLKRSYSRLMLYNNYPCRVITNAKTGRREVINTTVTSGEKKETVSSLQNETNWRVLIPFYKDVTQGRDLLTDMRYCLDTSKYRPYIGWII